VKSFLKERNLSGCTATVLMIEPIAFGFNPQTAVNNYFQQKDNRQSGEIQRLALAEFAAMVAQLRAEGIQVIVEKDTVYPLTPDSIFPNNWISFHTDKAVFYPMFAPNRRLERRMEVVMRVEKQLQKHYELIDYSENEFENSFLEGTGSIVLDRANRIAYTALSPRTDKDLFEKFCEDMHYRPFSFIATQQIDNEHLPIYHTNVMMSIASELAIVCLEAVESRDERENLKSLLMDTHKQIVEISLTQMHSFAGNMLQLKNNQDETFMLMSRTAYNSLGKSQIEVIEEMNKIIVSDIPTIEKNGGGSVRCMVAEVF